MMAFLLSLNPGLVCLGFMQLDSLYAPINVAQPFTECPKTILHDVYPERAGREQRLMPPPWW